MKIKLSENAQVFIYGAVATCLVCSYTSNLFETAVAFVALEVIWLMVKIFRDLYQVARFSKNHQE